MSNKNLLTGVHTEVYRECMKSVDGRSVTAINDGNDGRICGAGESSPGVQEERVMDNDCR